MNKRIGLDAGGVIIDLSGSDTSDPHFQQSDNARPVPMSGAFEAVRELVQRLGAENVYIVSTANETNEEDTRLWLAVNGFYPYTGFDPDNLFFCRTRAEKAPIVRELGVTHFVDDRIEVLEYMTEIVPNRYLFGGQIVCNPSRTDLTSVVDWAQALASIL